jgi:hypothetical protein
VASRRVGAGGNGYVTRTWTADPKSLVSQCVMAMPTGGEYPSDSKSCVFYPLS